MARLLCLVLLMAACRQALLVMNFPLYAVATHTVVGLGSKPNMTHNWNIKAY